MLERLKAREIKRHFAMDEIKVTSDVQAKRVFADTLIFETLSGYVIS